MDKGHVYTLPTIAAQLIDKLDPQPNRPGLAETPERVARAWEFWTGGYKVVPASLLKTFEDGTDRYDELVMVRDIPFYSHCEHHLAPFFGTASVGYIVNGKVLGLSKFARIVDCFARRLQTQERITMEVADLLENSSLDPKGVGVVLKARHMCMESRGVRQQGHHTITQAFRGVFRSDVSARAEFMSAVNSPRLL